MTKDEAIKKVLSVASNYVGYLEKNNKTYLNEKTLGAGDGNYTIFWEKINPTFQGQPYCAAYVSYCIMEAFDKSIATQLLHVWPYVYCPSGASLAKQYGE